MLKLLTNRTIRTKMTLVFALFTSMIVGGAIIGIFGLGASKQDLDIVYADGLVPIVQLSSINELTRRSIQDLTIAAITRGSSETTGRYVKRVGENEAEIDKLLAEFAANPVAEDEAALAEDWNAKRKEFVDKALKPAIASLQAAEFSDAEDIILGVAVQRYNKAHEAFDAVLKRKVGGAEAAQRHAQFRYEVTSKVAIFASIAALICAGLMLFFVNHSMVTPLLAMTATMKAVATGHFDSTSIAHIDRADEIGHMAAAIEVFRQNAIERGELAQREEAALARRETRRIRIDDATQRFQQGVSALLGQVKISVEHVHRSADMLSANAEQTERQSATVASATEEATVNVETVSAAGSELTASIQEISRQVQQSAQIAQDAAVEADETNRKIEGLANAAHNIGEIVGLINSIASQTSLLALNATIESARAGEAGKGFAVVAHEVKNLAGQTSRATDQIAEQIAAIQDETKAAVGAIGQITTTIGSINELATSIAGAVEEQGAATQEIARSVELASIGTRQVSTNIAEVVTAAAETGRMAQQLFQAANDLMGQSSNLEGEVERFLAEVRQV